MASEMVERVAKAVMKAELYGDYCLGEIEANNIAKVAIAAMREPTKEMIDGCLHEDIARYKSMIDKALEE